ncbi:MAG: hypothetical protein WC333_02305 [Dehalococcoidia bacterium]|jgi:hypothetical protein
MTYDDSIREIKSLIDDYEMEKRRLEDMIDAWENGGDPCSDPGLQYEQEMRVEETYRRILKFAVNEAKEQKIS